MTSRARSAHLTPQPLRAAHICPEPALGVEAASTFPLLPLFPLPPLLPLLPDLTPPLTPFLPSSSSESNRNTFSNRIGRTLLKTNRRASPKSQQKRTFSVEEAKAVFASRFAASSERGPSPSPACPRPDSAPHAHLPYFPAPGPCALGSNLLSSNPSRSHARRHPRRK